MFGLRGMSTSIGSTTARPPGVGQDTATFHAVKAAANSATEQQLCTARCCH